MVDCGDFKFVSHVYNLFTIVFIQCDCVHSITFLCLMMVLLYYIYLIISSTG